MSQRGEEWASRFYKPMGLEIKRRRGEKGWSVQRLSDELETRHGVTLNRPVLSNLENGRRPTLGVHEWFALADVLDLPALLMLVPHAPNEGWVEVLPEIELHPHFALKWLETGYLVDDVRLRPSDDAEEVRRRKDYSRIIARYREHETRVSRWRFLEGEARAVEQHSDDSARIAAIRAEQDSIVQALRDGRDLFRRDRLEPPPLPRSHTSRPLREQLGETESP